MAQHLKGADSLLEVVQVNQQRLGCSCRVEILEERLDFVLLDLHLIKSVVQVAKGSLRVTLVKLALKFCFHELEEGLSRDALLINLACPSLFEEDLDLFHVLLIQVDFSVVLQGMSKLFDRHPSVPVKVILVEDVARGVVELNKFCLEGFNDILNVDNEGLRSFFTVESIQELTLSDDAFATLVEVPVEMI